MGRYTYHSDALINHFEHEEENSRTESRAQYPERALSLWEVQVLCKMRKMRANKTTNNDQRSNLLGMYRYFLHDCDLCSTSNENYFNIRSQTFPLVSITFSSAMLGLTNYQLPLTAWRTCCCPSWSPLPTCSRWSIWRWNRAPQGREYWILSIHIVIMNFI